MPKPILSPDFTIEDIHKIREYNYETTKNMTKEERRAYYKAGSDRMQRRIAELREKSGTDHA